MVEPCDCFINEFYNKPQEVNKVMITDLVDQFCTYYENHPTKKVIYFRDRYGDSRQPNVKNSMSFNNQAIEQFKLKGWLVEPKSHKGMEPPQHDKYLLWMNILKANDPRFPKVIFKGKNCKYTLISMNNTKVIERNGKFDKDKNSERKKIYSWKKLPTSRMLPINGFGRNMGISFMSGFRELMWDRGCKIQ